MIFGWTGHARRHRQGWALKLHWGVDDSDLQDFYIFIWVIGPFGGHFRKAKA